MKVAPKFGRSIDEFGNPQQTRKESPRAPPKS